MSSKTKRFKLPNYCDMIQLNICFGCRPFRLSRVLKSNRVMQQQLVVDDLPVIKPYHFSVIIHLERLNRSIFYAVTFFIIQYYSGVFTLTGEKAVLQ